MGSARRQEREEEESEHRRLLTQPLLSSHEVGGECPSLHINRSGFGSLVGESDKYTFNWDGKHSVGFTCFKMP